MRPSLTCCGPSRTTSHQRDAVSLALAEGGAINAADTAWMISATGLVLMMNIPGLALFYCGMVRKKNGHELRLVRAAFSGTKVDPAKNTESEAVRQRTLWRRKMSRRFVSWHQS